MPLARYSEETAERLHRESVAARDPTEARQLSTMEQVARSLEGHVDRASARDKARTATINDLIAARIVGLGRPADSYLFEKVSESFWIGAAIDWVAGSASRDGRTVIDIRVVPADILLPFNPVAQHAPGRPSKEEVIRAAIAAYAKEDPTLSRQPTVRYRAYRTHIASQGYDPKEAGFSEKTFEKYERKFRIENK